MSTKSDHLDHPVVSFYVSLYNHSLDSADDVRGYEAESSQRGRPDQSVRNKGSGGANRRVAQVEAAQVSRCTSLMALDRLEDYPSATIANNVDLV